MNATALVEVMAWTTVHETLQAVGSSTDAPPARREMARAVLPRGPSKRA